MSAPTVRSVGDWKTSLSSPVYIDTAGGGLPSGAAEGDLLIVVIESTQTNTVAGTTAQGGSPGTTWYKLFEEAEGDGATLVTSLAVWACIMPASYGYTTFFVNTIQNHIEAQCIAITTGTHGVSTIPDDLVIGTGAGKSSGYSCVLPGITVDADSLILGCIAVSDDANDTDNITAFSNSNLANLTEQFDQGQNGGAGGGVALWTGDYASGGATGDSTATHDNTINARFVHIGVPPAGGGGGWTGSIVFWPDDDMG